MLRYKWSHKWNQPHPVTQRKYKGIDWDATNRKSTPQGHHTNCMQNWYRCRDECNLQKGLWESSSRPQTKTTWSTTVQNYNIWNLGSCQLYVHHKGDVRAVTFEVTEVPGPAMIGCKTCSEFELVKFNCNLAQKRESKDTTHPVTNKATKLLWSCELLREVCGRVLVSSAKLCKVWAWTLQDYA